MIYNPQPSEKSGYHYHVEIIEEALLTYQQHVERENKTKLSGFDPEDNTSWDQLDWYKVCIVQFAEKEWENFIIRVRDFFKRNSGKTIHNGDGYIYYSKKEFGIGKVVIHRSKFSVTHSTIIEMEKDKFINHLTTIGRFN